MFPTLTGAGPAAGSVASLTTVIGTLLVAVDQFAVSAGVKVTDRICAGATGRVAPAAGVNTNVPGTLAVAFNCAGPSGVPKTISAGAGHVMTGIAFPAGTISTAAKFQM